MNTLEHQVAQRQAAADKIRNQAIILAKQSEVAAQKSTIEEAKIEVLYAKSDLEGTDKADKIARLEAQSALKQAEAALLYYRAKLLKLQDELKALKPIKVKVQAPVIVEVETEKTEVFERMRKIIDNFSPPDVLDDPNASPNLHEVFQYPEISVPELPALPELESIEIIEDELPAEIPQQIESKTAAELEDEVNTYITLPDNLSEAEYDEFHTGFHKCIFGHFFLNKWKNDGALIDQAAIDMTNADDYFAIITTGEIDELHYLHGMKFSHEDGKITYIRKTYKTVKGVQNAGAKWLNEE